MVPSIFTRKHTHTTDTRSPTTTTNIYLTEQTIITCLLYILSSSTLYSLYKWNIILMHQCQMFKTLPDSSSVHIDSTPKPQIPG